MKSKDANDNLIKEKKQVSNKNTTDASNPIETSNVSETNITSESITLEEALDLLKKSEEKNQSLAKLLKKQSVELKKATKQGEKQFEMIGRLANENKELNEELDKKNESLEEEKAFASSYKEKLITLETLEKDNLSLKNANQDLSRSLEELQKSIQEKEEILKQTTEQLSETTNNYEKIKNLNVELNQKQTDLTLKCESLETVVLQQQAKLNQYTSIGQKEEQEKNETTDKKDVLKQDLLKELEKQKEEIRSKDRIIVSQIDEIKNLNEKNSKLFKEKDHFEKKCAELKGDLKNLSFKEVQSNANQSDKPNESLLINTYQGNDLDIKMSKATGNFGKIEKEKILTDSRVASLIEKIENEINGEKNKDDTTIVSINIDDYKAHLLERIPSFVFEFTKKIIEEEATSYDYLVSLIEKENEIDDIEDAYKKNLLEKDEKIKLLEDELNKFKVLYYKMEETGLDRRTMKEIKEDDEILKKQNELLSSEVLALNKEDTNETIRSLILLFESERKMHKETEFFLKNKIAILKGKNDELSSKLNEFNGDYLLNKLKDDYDEMLAFMDKVKKGEIELHSHIFEKYYEEAYSKFLQQGMIYKDEIEKRNAILKEILELNLSKQTDEDEALVLHFEDTNLVNDKSLERIKNDITTLINTELVELDIDTKKTIDEKLIEEMKEKINKMYSNMIKNIQEKIINFDKQISNLNVDYAKEFFFKDTKHMAELYNEQINEVVFEDKLSSNEFSKLLNHSKIAILSNEFAILLRYKEKMLSTIISNDDLEKTTYDEELKKNQSSQQASLETVKEELNKRIVQVKSEYEKEKERIQKQLNDTKFVLDQLALQLSMNEKDASLKVQYESKKKVYDYLLNTEYKQMEDKYNSLITAFNNDLDELINNSKGMKELYFDRMDNVNAIKRDFITVKNEIVRTLSIHDINDYLSKINNIDEAYFSINSEKDNEIDSQIEGLKKLQEEQNKVYTAYQNLISLKTQYEKIVTTLKSDYEEVRDYDYYVLENNYCNRQIAFYQKEMERSKDFIKYQTDEQKNKDALLMYKAKIFELNEIKENNTLEMDKLKNIPVVLEYVNTCSKIAKIDETIKDKYR